MQLHDGLIAEASYFWLWNCSTSNDGTEDFLLGFDKKLRLEANRDYCVAKGHNNSVVLQKCDGPACTNNCEWEFPKPNTVTLPAADGYYEIGSAAVEVFIDGSIMQVFFNGDVITSLDHNCSSTEASLILNGGDALVHLDAWKMMPAGMKTDDGSEVTQDVPTSSSTLKTDDGLDFRGTPPLICGAAEHWTFFATAWDATCEMSKRGNHAHH